MLGVLAVVLCRLLVTCAGVTVGVLDSGACATVLAVASFVFFTPCLVIPSGPGRPVCLYRRVPGADESDRVELSILGPVGPTLEGAAGTLQSV